MNPKSELEELDRQWIKEKQRHEYLHKHQRLGIVGWMAMMVGFGFVLLGLWLHSLGADVRLERMLSPWPAVCMVLGTCIVLGALALLIRTGRRLRAYYQAKAFYDHRRDALLQDVYTSVEVRGSEG